MAKIYFLVLAVFLTLNSTSQSKDLPKFDFENYYFPKALVIDVKDKNQVQLKNDVRSWIKNYFTESSLIDYSYSENSFLITGKSIRLLKIKNLPTDLKYDIKISLRDNKYKFEIKKIYYKYYTEFREISNVNLIKDDIIKNDLLESRSIISSFFHDLNSNLFNTITAENNGW